MGLKLTTPRSRTTCSPMEPSRHPKMTSFSLGLCWFPVPSLLLILSNPLTPRYLLSALASWLGFLDILLTSSCTGVLIPQVQVPAPDTAWPSPHPDQFQLLPPTPYFEITSDYLHISRTLSLTEDKEVRVSKVIASKFKNCKIYEEPEIN